MKLNFKKGNGLLPAIVQHINTREVLMLAYVNEESFNKSIETGETWFYSRSREELWHKGGTSGNIQKIREIRVDCDEDTIIFLVESLGPACHTGENTCFYRNYEED